MKCDPKFATSPIFIDDKDYEFSVDPELITLVESDPFHGYETETVAAHRTKLNDIATLFTHDDASTLLDDDVPLGEFLDEQIARVRQHDIVESDDELETENLETPTRTSPPRYELPKVPEGYAMSEEATRDILACKDRDELEKLLCKYKERSLNAKMK